MALRLGLRGAASTYSKAKSAKTSSWVLSTKGTTTLHGDSDKDNDGQQLYLNPDNKTYTLNGKVYDLSYVSWENVAQFHDLFDHDLPGPSLYEIYKSVRTGLPIDQCIGMKPPTASDYVYGPEDPSDEVHDDPHDEDSYSESEDYGVYVAEPYRNDREMLRFFRVRNRIWKAIRRQKDRKAREGEMRKN